MLDMKHGSSLSLDDLGGAPPPTMTPFDYLLPDLNGNPDAHLPADDPGKITDALKALGTAMVDDASPVETDPKVDVNSTIPPIYTYWGQFIDHDLTANTDRDSAVSDVTKAPVVPLDPVFVVENLKNLRSPKFDLDHVYGNGPTDPTPDRGFYDGIHLRVGTCTDAPGIPGVKIPPEADLDRDLPRIGPLLAAGVITEDDIPPSIKTDVNRATRAFIGDLRNDENLIVAQFHCAMLRFHNKVIDAVKAAPLTFGLADGAADGDLFDTAHRLVQFHYQWLVVNDFLKTVTFPGVVDKILVGGNQFYQPLPDGELFAPLEFSVAAYRYGHSMVRGGYDHNRNFGQAVPPAGNVLPFAPFAELFHFTGNGFKIDPTDITKSVRDPMRGAPTLPFNWIIEWDRLTRKFDANEAHFARKIDTRLAPPILNMVNEGTAAPLQDDTNPGNKALRQLLRSLAQRNLLRGYLLSLPTGQAVAGAMGVSPLSEAELRQNNTPALNAALDAGGFIEKTPLWYYVLKEAEVRANGNSLGELGSQIVVETQIGMMRGDPDSYLNVEGGWDPAQGVAGPNGPIVTIRDLLALTDVPV